MRFESTLFPKFNQLSNFEKLTLRYCCYYPPKKRRERSKLIIDIEQYQSTQTNAFGSDFWHLIKNKKVLDFGCGEGGFVVGMAAKVNCFAEGIDIFDEFEVAKNYIKDNGVKNIKFHVGRSSILENESYDVIISHDSFEHFEDPKYILNEMTRMLKPGGYLLIKFGPTWMSPYGRHMSGTFKKSRPWIHLLFSEKAMMRVHSVYHNEKILKNSYKELKGGLNKMTIAKAKKIIKYQKELKIESMKISPWRSMSFLMRFPILKELFGSGVYFKCRKNDENIEI